jgi:hypothetical protein
MDRMWGVAGCAIAGGAFDGFVWETGSGRRVVGVFGIR